MMFGNRNACDQKIPGSGQLYSAHIYKCQEMPKVANQNDPNLLDVDFIATSIRVCLLQKIRGREEYTTFKIFKLSI